MTKYVWNASKELTYEIWSGSGPTPYFSNRCAPRAMLLRCMTWTDRCARVPSALTVHMPVSGSRQFEAGTNQLTSAHGTVSWSTSSTKEKKRWTRATRSPFPVDLHPKLQKQYRAEDGHTMKDCIEHVADTYHLPHRGCSVSKIEWQ